MVPNVRLEQAQRQDPLQGSSRCTLRTRSLGACPPLPKAALGTLLPLLLGGSDLQSCRRERRAIIFFQGFRRPHIEAIVDTAQFTEADAEAEREEAIEEIGGGFGHGCRGWGDLNGPT